MNDPALARQLANGVLVIHFLFVLAIIMPIPLILIGAQKNWSWVRNRKLRLIHLSMMGIVVLETIFGIFCPLTEWEQTLRKAAGDPTYEGSFIGNWVSRLLYYEFDPRVFATLYFAIGALILYLYRRVPPSSLP